MSDMIRRPPALLLATVIAASLIAPAVAMASTVTAASFTGGSGTVPIPPDRWDVAGLATTEAKAPGKIRTEGGGFLDGIDVRKPNLEEVFLKLTEEAPVAGAPELAA